MFTDTMESIAAETSKSERYTLTAGNITFKIKGKITLDKINQTLYHLLYNIRYITNDILLT